MMKKDNAIHFIITGGTIDSYYDGAKDTVVPNKKSIIPDYIKNLKLYRKCYFDKICMKDSRELDGEDVAKILKIIKNDKYKNIIITHGTYTMPDTARYLKAHLKNNNKKIILTGSMIPLFGFLNSDAPFNLGYAISSFDYLKPGIYVCMNGRIFSPEETLKILKEGRFSSIFGE